MKRVILIVTDSFGVGELPDAAEYGDAGTSTLGSILKKDPTLYVPNMRNLGLFNIDGVEESLRGKGVPPTAAARPVPVPVGSYGKCAEASKGKDSTTGHWEIAGLVTEVPFNTYDAFPEEFISAFEERTGRKVICNAKASGTAII
ncbi:MAG: phosphopentomutase, partial [Firmicutes bacterium]|nr:phosphopentomutase [Bacillota bacterium]